MKKAYEIFEELGYREVPNLGMLKYQKGKFVILFDDRNKMYVVYKEVGIKEIIVDIEIQLHLAIHQQMKELGWIE